MWYFANVNPTIAAQWPRAKPSQFNGKLVFNFQNTSQTEETRLVGGVRTGGLILDADKNAWKAGMKGHACPDFRAFYLPPPLGVRTKCWGAGRMMQLAPAHPQAGTKTHQCTLSSISVRLILAND